MMMRRVSVGALAIGLAAVAGADTRYPMTETQARENRRKVETFAEKAYWKGAPLAACAVEAMSGIRRTPDLFPVDGDFTGPVKEQMAFAVRHDMEDVRFLTPDDRFVIADFRKIRKEETSSGNVRFTGERDANGHADRFWAAALCREAKGTVTPLQKPVISSRRRSYENRSID